MLRFRMVNASKTTGISIINKNIFPQREVICQPSNYIFEEPYKTLHIYNFSYSEMLRFIGS